MIETSVQKETAVLVGVIQHNETKERVSEHLNELEFLVETAGADTKKRFVQRLNQYDSRTFVGAGKLSEIQSYIKEHEIDIAVFDDELSPSQIRNIEKELKCRILDRNNLILDIFAKRARS